MVVCLVVILLCKPDHVSSEFPGSGTVVKVSLGSASFPKQDKAPPESAAVWNCVTLQIHQIK